VYSVQDTFDVRILMAETHKYTVDFRTASETDLHDMVIPVSFDIQQAGNVHGLAFWFEVAFLGSTLVCLLLCFHYSQIKVTC
jgi:type I protein arginine methyltransferase